jgi:hypothetical protein
MLDIQQDLQVFNQYPESSIKYLYGFKDKLPIYHLNLAQTILKIYKIITFYMLVSDILGVVIE